MRVLIIPPAGAVEVREIDGKLGDYQGIVGGYIEAVTLPAGAVGLVNEEGALRGGLAVNPRATALVGAAGLVSLPFGIMGVMVCVGAPDENGDETPCPQALLDLFPICKKCGRWGMVEVRDVPDVWACLECKETFHLPVPEEPNPAAAESGTVLDFSPGFVFSLLHGTAAYLYASTKEEPGAALLLPRVFPGCKERRDLAQKLGAVADQVAEMYGLDREGADRG